MWHIIIINQEATLAFTAASQWVMDVSPTGLEIATDTVTNASTIFGKNEEQLPQKTVGRLLADSRLTVGRQSTDSRPTVGRLSADCRLPPSTKIFCRQSADCWPHVGNLLAKCWLRTLVEYQKSLSSQGRTLHIDAK